MIKKMEEKETGRASIREVYEINKRLEEKLDNFIESTNRALDKRFDELNDRYVTRVEFWPVKVIVYGGAGMILTAVMGAIIFLATGHQP